MGDDCMMKVLNKLPVYLGYFLAGFLVIFSFDVFTEESTLMEEIIGLIMHNIPSMVLVCVVLIGKRKPLVGGLSFLSVSLFYLVMISDRVEHIIYALPIALPGFIIGLLFLFNWYHMRKLSEEKKIV